MISESAEISIYDEQGIKLNTFKEINTFLTTEPEFFDVFDWKWVNGSPKTSLSDPNSIVLTERLAEKYFGGDAMGKTVRWNDKRDLKVTGIVKNPPSNSSYGFDGFVHHQYLMEQLGKAKEKWSFVNGAYQLCIVLKEGLDYEEEAKEIASLLTNTLVKKMGEERGKSSNWYIELQPLSDIHFNPELGPIKGSGFDLRTLWILAIVGVFLVLIASVNYVNLSTALALKRG